MNTETHISLPAVKRATKVNVYALRTTILHLASRAPGEGVPTSGRVRDLSCRMFHLLPYLLPALSHDEWMLIMLANPPTETGRIDPGDNVNPESELTRELDLSHIAENVAEADDIQSQYPDVNIRDLAARLRAMAPAMLIAIDEAIDRFWQYTEYPDQQALKLARIVPHEAK